jgi:hypothetical protein
MVEIAGFIFNLPAAGGKWNFPEIFVIARAGRGRYIIRKQNLNHLDLR